MAASSDDETVREGKGRARIEDSRTATIPPGRPTPRITRGTLIKRYVILDPLGEGGMATVYAAYDTELHRRVALKFLHQSAAGDHRVRLLREAQTMAQLAHPN